MATEIQEFTLYGGEVKVKFYPNSHMYKVTDDKYGLKDERVKGVTTYIGILDKSPALVSWATELAGTHLLDLLESGKVITAGDIAKSIGLHAEKKEEAADIGTKTHEWCEYFIKHKLGRVGFEKEPELPTNQAMLLGVDSFLEFITQRKVEFISSERIVYSRKHQYIGTMDFEAIVDGKLSVGDFKTSNGLYNSVFMQMSAYQFAAEEEAEFLGNPIKYENRYAVRLAKETEQEYSDRMIKKNSIRELQGKLPNKIKPYQPFEWIVESRETHERDFAGFISAKDLFTWNNQTDFYKNKK
jgi:hypothetical protein